MAIGTPVTVDFYQNNSLSNPIQRLFLSAQSVTVGASPSNVTFTVPPSVTSGSSIIATATVSANGTSIFSGPVTVTSPLTVTNTNPSGTGSLAGVIAYANAHPGTAASPDVISFLIPQGDPNYDPGTHSWVIHQSTALPIIGTVVVIDATSQPGYTSTPVIRLDGGGLTVDGLVLGIGLRLQHDEGAGYLPLCWSGNPHRVGP